VDDDTETGTETDPLAWETLDRRIAYACEGFDVRNERVRLPDGTEAEYDYLSEPPSVVVVPFVGDGEDPGDPADREVVVIEEWRQAVGRVNRGLPAGGVEDGDDDLAAAAHRELAEETGYRADRVEPLATFEPANGIADALLHYFVAYGCVPADEQRLDYNESIRVETTTLAALREAVRDGEIRDGRTATGVLYHQLYG
jgi:ADP-ribose pyrophosphatase